MVAIGGWGDTEGFSEGARTEEGRKLFSENVGKMVEAVGADGESEDFQRLSFAGGSPLFLKPGIVFLKGLLKGYDDERERKRTENLMIDQLIHYSRG